MNLLVTGGLGFIASNFIRYMLKEDDKIQITNVDNFSYGSNALNLIEVKKNPRYKFMRGDITKTRLLSNLVKNADVIVNAASETHVDRSISTPLPFLKSNTIGTFTILESARKCNPDAKIIQVSTDEVYGDITQGSFSEHHQLKPSSPYASSKAAAEMFALAYNRTYGLNVMITRSTNNFGPYQSPEKLIPKTIIRAYLDLPVPIYGKGDNVRDWLYVLDHCRAITQIIEKGKPGEIYNISSGNEITNLQIVRSILEIIQKPTKLIQFVDNRPGHDYRYSLDCNKIRTEIGWSPIHNFNDALKETIEWYLTNKSWWMNTSKKMLHTTPWKTKW